MAAENLANKMGNNAPALRLALLLALWWQLAAPVCAHAAPFSYVDLHLSRGQMEMELVVRVANLAHELNEAAPQTLLDPAKVESKRDAILSLLRSNLQFAADGQALDLELLGIEPD